MTDGPWDVKAAVGAATGRDLGLPGGFVAGHDALRAMERAGSGLRHEEERIADQARRLDAEAVELRAEKARCYAALAADRLDRIEREEIRRRLDRVESRAREALAVRRTRLEEAGAERHRLNADIDAAEAERQAADEALAGAVEAVERLAETTARALDDNPGWQARAGAAREAEARAARAEAKAAQAEADRQEKRAAYDADPLFSYLWKRGYGTSAYRAGPVVRFGDARVARLIGYQAARLNFHKLNEIPDRLTAHAGRVRASAGEADAALAAFEREALEAAGIGALEERAEACETRVARAARRLDELRQALGALDQREARLLEPRGDPEVAKALDALAESLAREDLGRLVAEARATPGPEDDRLLARIGEIDARLEAIEAEQAEIRRTVRDLAAKRTELDRAQGEFRRRGWGHPRGGFDSGELIGEVIGGVLKGAMRSGGLGGALGGGYRRSRPRVRPGFGGGWGGSRGGGGSGGGFRTGGGF